MPYNYSKLRGRIVEKFRSQGKFTKELGVSERSLSLKLTGKRPFKQTEITKACELLDIKKEDIGEYFFNLKVQ